MARLLDKYKKEVIKELTNEFKYTSPMAVPKLEKVIINMGVGKGHENKKLLDTSVDEITQITGQKAVKTVAKKSISNFKLRKGMLIGTKVTLRGSRMYEFLDKLMNVALPRVRDFKGVNTKSFDGRGNYSLGIKEQIIFPEIDYDKVDAVRGMDICIVNNSKNR